MDSVTAMITGVLRYGSWPAMVGIFVLNKGSVGAANL